MSLQFRFNQLHIRCVVRFVIEAQSVINSLSLIADFLPAKQIRSHHPILSVVIYVIRLTEHWSKAILHLCKCFSIAELKRVLVDLLSFDLAQKTEAVSVRFLITNGVGS